MQFEPAGEERKMHGKSSDVFTIDELSDYLKVSKSTLYKLVREGKVPSQKVGRHWRFHRETIDRWLGEREKQMAKNSSGKKKWRS
jgi:excisionase family DNA binding protein